LVSVKLSLIRLAVLALNSVNPANLHVAGSYHWPLHLVAWPDRAAGAGQNHGD
jgi:hypothetical protein